MSLVFKTIQTEGIAELSYLVGDDDEGIAAVFDPRPDCDVYIAMARETGVAITHIFETHIHADLVSGSRELYARLDGAKIYSSYEGGVEYGFDNEPVNDGDRFEFGEVVITARHTPGHTPEHMSYLLADVDHADEGSTLVDDGENPIVIMKHELIHEFRDRRALHLIARLQLGHGNLHERRAGVGRQNVLLMIDLVRHEGAHRGVGFEASVRAVPNLDACGFARFGERIWNGAQAGREFLVGEAGDIHLAVYILD